MRHTYQCPMRWADLDLLGHVNNVVYVDYLQEARVDMMRTHAPDTRAEDLAEGVVVVRHRVTYQRPLTFRFRPVSIECWVTEVRAASFTMAYEVFDDTDEGRVVHLRATTLLTPYVFAHERPRRLRPEERAALERFLEPEPSERPPYAEPQDVEPAHYPVHVRFSDVDVYGHVNNVKYFEYLQEGRIVFLSGLSDGGLRDDVDFVTAQTDVDYRVPILFREEPYDCNSWISRVGERSFTVDSVICDGPTVLARARVVLVFFDRAEQRSKAAPPKMREALLARLSGAGVTPGC